MKTVLLSHIPHAGYSACMFNIFLITLGIAMLVKASDIMIDGASSLARRFKMSELAIAITIVAFGTSAPETVITLSSAIGGYANIAVGNIVGSNIFRTLGILGIVGLVAPIVNRKTVVGGYVLFSLLASMLLLILPNLNFLGGRGILSRFDGVIMLLVFAWFLFYIYQNSKKIPRRKKHVHLAPILPLWKSTCFILLGLAALVVGGDIVVKAAVSMAHTWGVSDKIIALTIVAAGTSLPELMVSVSAALRKNNDIVIGNIVGSNIFSILFILGLASVMRPMSYSLVFSADMLVLIFATAILYWAMFIGRHKQLSRPAAALFLALYIGYVWYILIR